MPTRDTATSLLDCAQQMVQERGYNAFSYKDLAEQVGIRTASIHYHFATKGDLGKALMERYHAGLEAALAEIESRHRTSRARLKAFIGVYRETEERGVVCLCGSLAADLETLPPEVQALVAGYLARSEGWVTQTLTAGLKSGEYRLASKPADAAATLLSSLQGGLFLSRALSGSAGLERIQRGFLASLESD